ncbi:TolC family protein [Bacteroides ihuae]|uniref:TolC family protein n=1 Tax=Bacteroides ihuae TaxID=1852362 RepID=UPI00098EBBA4|nr:TolC family protein [Bacteroides ihuae]
MTIKTKTLRVCLILALPFFLSGRIVAQDQTLSLKECINYTLQHHPNSTIYQNSAKSAKEKIRESRSALLPSVAGNVGLDYNLKLATSVIPAGSFGTEETKLQMGNKFSNSAYVELDQKLFDRSAFLDVKTSKVNKEIADLNLLKENETLIYNTASAYYEVLTYAEKGKLLRESEKRYETTVSILKLRYAQGEEKKSEYTRARVNYNNVQFEIESNNSSYKLALNKLKNSIGMDIEVPISIEDSITDIDVKELPLAIGLNDFDTNSLLDFQIDQKNLSAKKLDIKQKKAAYLPTLSLYGKYGGNGYGSNFFPALGNWYDYSVIGVKATIPIFSGFKKQSQLAQSKLSLASMELTNKLNLQEYKLNIENASTDIVSTYTNLKKSKENLQLATEMMDASMVEYQEGTATLSSLLDTDYSYKEARTNYTTSLLDYLTAQLSYYKNTGTISQFVNEIKQ